MASISTAAAALVAVAAVLASSSMVLVSSSLSPLAWLLAQWWTTVLTHALVAATTWSAMRYAVVSSTKAEAAAVDSTAIDAAATGLASQRRHPTEFSRLASRFDHERTRAFPPPYPNAWYSLFGGGGGGGGGGDVRAFDKNSAQHDRRRNKVFPPPFPNGWIMVCSSEDIDHGGVRSLAVWGRDMVAFRNERGVACVVDAWCPHLGTHLGEGGTVVDGKLQCPFHHWRFDGTSGRATDIPYCTGTLPAQARLERVYHTHEQLERIFVWFDAENRPPTWQLRQFDELPFAPTRPNTLADGASDDAAEPDDYQRTDDYPRLAAGRSYRRVIVQRSMFQMHASEMAENSADEVHFNTLHRPVPFSVGGVVQSLLNRWLYMRHTCRLWMPDDVERERRASPSTHPAGVGVAADEQRNRELLARLPASRFEHLMYFENSTTIKRRSASAAAKRGVVDGQRFFADRDDDAVLVPTEKAHLIFEGPALVHFWVYTPLGLLRLVKMNVPVAPFRTYSEDHWFAESGVPYIVARLVAAVGAGALEQDRRVWEAKGYQLRPVLVRGDGPFVQFRRWFFRFYSANSQRVAAERDAMSW